MTLELDRVRGAWLRVRGVVQGVGFRPLVWRRARALELVGSVWNDRTGVEIEAWGTESALAQLEADLLRNPPPLARIDGIERRSLESQAPRADFVIAKGPPGSPGSPGSPRSSGTRPRATTAVAPDAATCELCLAEVRDPLERRFRYPLANCTACGPRFSITRALPYDRCHTTMEPFPLCTECAREYADPGDRRFHAQPVACHVCGPQVLLERTDDRVCSSAVPDAMAELGRLLQQGELVAIQGIGGFHLACDATRSDSVERLRARKRRPHKPLALMARDLEVVRRYAHVSTQEQQLLSSPAAPIVLLETRADGPAGALLAPGVARGLPLSGFMLPHAPLQHLMLADMERPLVMTSGNLSEAPPCTQVADARRRLAPIADWIVTHGRAIENRVDDSVVRVMAGSPRLLRRSRGYAPAPLPLPPGFEDAPGVLAQGADLKNTFCLLGQGQAVVSQHIGDLADARVHDDYTTQLALLERLFDQRPEVIAVDLHPDYASSAVGRSRARAEGLALEPVQHHHAHVAACLFEHGVPHAHPPVLGVALDGLGFGADGALWGGEFLLADYTRCERRGSFKPVALLGGDRAAREPWRNTLAQLLADMGWPAFERDYAGLELASYLAQKPIPTLARMAPGAPTASSCGRLFDAVAAAVGVCREAPSYEGQAACELEGLVDAEALLAVGEDAAYPFAIRRPHADGLPRVEPSGLWSALLADLRRGTPPGVIAARFHRGLAQVLARMVAELSSGVVDTVVLSGGVFANRTLLELLLRDLEPIGLRVLHHRLVPCGDGGLSLGQAAVAAARQLSQRNKARIRTCA